MQASTLKIQEIFQSNIVLKIPYFQRSYVWKEENWDRFLEDMLDLPETGDNYFLGSLILKKNGTNELGYDMFDVVDGQQRLTTLVIFSKVLYLLAGRNDKFNNNFMQDEVNEPILKPNRKDASVYRQIVDLELIGSDVPGTGRVKEAFEYFRKKMNVATIRDRANTLIRFMNNNVYLVRIIVEESENEQQIFDTINSLGQDLTTGELLKNHLFNDGNVDIYDNKWAPIFDRGGSDYNYWMEKLTKGRLKANNIETFFYYFMLVKMQDPSIRTNITAIDKKKYRKQEGLFESYKSLIRKQNLDVDALIKEIVEYATIYKNSFNQSVLSDYIPKYAGIERLGCMMFAQGTWTPVPYLLYILKTVADNTERNKIFGLLETYLVRRIICKSKNNNYSDLFSENLIGQGVNTYEALKAYLTDDSNRGALLMPSEEDVKSAIESNNLAKESQILLYLLESRINSQFSTSVLNNGFESLDVEPVMPVKWESSNWPSTVGYDDEKREICVRTLGNHVLLRGSKLNAQKSASKWDTKVRLLTAAVPGLQTSSLITNGLPSWDETRIEARNAWLSTQFNELWTV